MPMVLRRSCAMRRGSSLVAWQDEGERSGRQRLEQAELPVVDARVGRDLGQVAAHQRELVVPVEVADATQAIGRVPVVEMAAERVAGIGRIRDHGALAQALGDPQQGALLRVHGVQFEPLGGHGLRRQARGAP